MLNEFNYTKKQREIKKINAEITQNSNVDRSLEIQAEEASFNTTYTNTFNVNPASNSYKKEVQDIFKTFQDFKEMFPITKFLKCIKI